MDAIQFGAGDLSPVAGMSQVSTGLRVRVRGRVQGVGFRPWLARNAMQLGLRGAVRNEGDAVRVECWGSDAATAELIRRLRQDAPAPSHVTDLDCEWHQEPCRHHDFSICESQAVPAGLSITPDLASCPECLQELFDPLARRYRYPFTSCSHCGPRLSIQHAIPWDRSNTSMQAFELCAACKAEYEDVDDRRFHAQQLACPDCGPALWFRSPVRTSDAGSPAALQAAIAVLQAGGILAVKSTGGWQLACDATSETALQRLRACKQRPERPFAMMARDLDVISSYASVSAEEATVLGSTAAPIVLLRARASVLPDLVAPGLACYGFMLPHSPLHHLLLEHFDVPLIMTSGNVAGSPQLVDDAQALAAFSVMADGLLGHDRGIAQRVDDSVLQLDRYGMQVLRAGRGYAPLSFPATSTSAVQHVLAMGAQLKNTFAIGNAGQITVSQHMGDLDAVRVREEAECAQALYLSQLQFRPDAVVVDLHPDYACTVAGEMLAQKHDIPLHRVQHHHAHLAACLLEHGLHADAPEVLGVVLDGLGLGADGELWGGEFLLGNYRACQRLGCFRPVPLLGGKAAMLEPWRNTFASLVTELGLESLQQLPPDLRSLVNQRDPPLLMSVLNDPVLSPPSSSCGRLFDAVAAAIGICAEKISYEGQAAMLLEAVVDHDALAAQSRSAGYPFSIKQAEHGGLACIESGPMWRALLEDLRHGAAVGLIAVRFHRGLAAVIVEMVKDLQLDQGERRFETVVLSGGVFQNQVLRGLVAEPLIASGLQVLLPGSLPAGDGGIAAGQAAIVMEGGA